MYTTQKLNEVHPHAKIGENVTIESFVVIQEDVEIGEGTWIGPHVTILNGTRIGKNCKIFPGAVLGAAPQDLKFGQEDTLLVIGDNVVIREYCTLNRGTKASFVTEIQDNCLLMAYVHVAHDCIIGHNSILANSVNLAGHVHVGHHTVIGGMCAVHQFVKIGEHAMVGGGSLVRKDVPPYVKASREPLSYAGVNSIGLKRRGFSVETVNLIQDVYRWLYVRGLPTTKAIAKIEENIPATPERDLILSFIRESERGIMKGFKQI